MMGILKGLATTLSTHFRRPVTVQYPDKHLPLSPRFMGFPGLVYDDAVGEPKCTGCQVCARNCPNNAIIVSMKDNEKAKEGKSPRRKIVDQFELDLARCMLCNIRVEVCAFDAIVMTPNHELASYSPQELVADLDRLIELGRAKGQS